MLVLFTDLCIDSAPSHLSKLCPGLCRRLCLRFTLSTQVPRSCVQTNQTRITNANNAQINPKTILAFLASTRRPGPLRSTHSNPRCASLAPSLTLQPMTHFHSFTLYSAPLCLTAHSPEKPNHPRSRAHTPKRRKLPLPPPLAHQYPPHNIILPRQVCRSPRPTPQRRRPESFEQYILHERGKGHEAFVGGYRGRGL